MLKNISKDILPEIKVILILIGISIIWSSWYVFNQ